MRVFVAAAPGQSARASCRTCSESGHEVVALSRTAQKARELDVLGARVAVADALDRQALTAAIRGAEPQVIIHQR